MTESLSNGILQKKNQYNDYTVRWILIWYKYFNTVIMQLPLFGAANRMRREATKSTREIKLQFSIAAAIEESGKDQVKKW